MNKEIIKHYKTEFDHWINGGTLLAYFKKDDESKWEEAEYYQDRIFFNFPIKDCIYIINDEYVELRKAEAEGKTIQLNDGTKQCPKWNAAYINKTPFETYPLILYRIEPIPKFKVDDWITTEGSNGGCTQRFLAVVTGEDSCKLATGIQFNSYISSLCKAEAWQPTVGELCVYWSNDEEYFWHIAPYHPSNTWENVAPLEFAQTLRDK